MSEKDKYTRGEPLTLGWLIHITISRRPEERIVWVSYRESRAPGFLYDEPMGLMDGDTGDNLPAWGFWSEGEDPSVEYCPTDDKKLSDLCYERDQAGELHLYEAIPTEDIKRGIRE